MKIFQLYYGISLSNFKHFPLRCSESLGYLNLKLQLLIFSSDGIRIITRVTRLFISLLGFLSSSEQCNTRSAQGTPWCPFCVPGCVPVVEMQQVNRTQIPGLVGIDSGRGRQPGSQKSKTFTKLHKISHK